MNFYTLNGSKIDSNNPLEDNKIYERFDNVKNKSSLLDDHIGEDENFSSDEFANVPTSKSSATDKNFQCSDGYAVKGSNFKKEFNNSNLEDCKKKCTDAGNDCIGFNFDKNKKVCVLKKNASSMNNNNNSTLCIKKSAGNS